MKHTSPGSFLIGKNILSQICSRIIFEMHTVPGAGSKWSIFDLEYSSRLLVVQDHMVLYHMVQEQLGPYGPIVQDQTRSRGQNLKKAFWCTSYSSTSHRRSWTNISRSGSLDVNAHFTGRAMKKKKKKKKKNYRVKTIPQTTARH